MNKVDRRHQNRQRQLEKQKEHRLETSIFSGRVGAPRNVALIPLSDDCDAVAAAAALNASVDIESEVTQSCSRVTVDRFKQKLQYFPATRDLTTCLDAARAADFVILILSAQREVDELGELTLRCVESQGLSTLFTVITGLGAIEAAKQRLAVVESLKSYMKHFHPHQDKLYNLDNRQECSNLMRSLCSTTPKGVRWRDERSWMLVEEVKPASGDEDATVLYGVVRGKGLKADRLVQVGDWGTFQVEKIVAAPLSTSRRKVDDAMLVDEEETLELPGPDQDGTEDLAPEEEIIMADEEVDTSAHAATTTAASGTTKKGVLLDNHHYFSEEEDAASPAQPKRLPRGTSTYQAAWYLDDDISDSGSDLDDYEMGDTELAEVSDGPEDGIEAGETQTEGGGHTEYGQSEMEMVVEPNEADDAEQLATFRSTRRDEAQEDREFPDEIELHPNVLARERLLRYRGLKSLRSSPWDEEEDRAHEPADWQRLLRIPEYQASRVRSAREALVGGVAPGTRVAVYLRGVPQSLTQGLDPSRPVTLFSLLRHEHKRTALNFLINLSSDYPLSIKSKEELVVQCGSRRLIANPVFSQSGNTPNDVHKYCRYLHPGQSAVATFMGPVTWGSVPVLFFKRGPPTEAGGRDGKLKLVATGTALPPSTSRVIAKRVILTGHPYHIHKKIVTVRYMFFNREDVEWFKALPLWTRRGRSGYIKESLGTHGYFKATFDGRVNPQDSIGVSLYKRVWPRNSAPYMGTEVGGIGPAAVAEGGAVEEDAQMT